nr:MAG TPA: hypothetical protein [Caudoviricetes sp.]
MQDCGSEIDRSYLHRIFAHSPSALWDSMYNTFFNSKS